MKRKLLSSLVISLTILQISLPAYTRESYYNEIDDILAAAESLFKAMKGKTYPAIWTVLTQKSKNTILKEVNKSSGVEYSKEQIRIDFSIGGLIAKSYWNGFLAHFDPDMVLEQSRWEMGSIRKDRAEIIIAYKSSERPSRLRMFKEDGSWKVGLVETFWTRK